MHDPMAYDISTFCKLASIGRTRAYQEIREGRLKARKVGRRTLITAEAAQEWLANLESV